LYEGWDLVGYPEKVFLRGKLIVDGDKCWGVLDRESSSREEKEKFSNHNF